MKFKWYYIAIPLGIFLLYEILSPKSALKGTKTSSSGGWLAGLGSAGTGISNLWDSVVGTSIAGGPSTDTSSTDATGD